MSSTRTQPKAADTSSTRKPKTPADTSSNRAVKTLHQKPQKNGRAPRVHCAHDALVAIGRLRPHPRNPNQHNERQVALLAKIISHQGWRSPIVISGRSGLIVAGHGRWEAAKRLGLKTVPVNTQDFASEADELAHLVADNQIAELAEMSDDMLAQLIKELQADAYDLDLLGMSALDIRELLFQFGHRDDPCDKLRERFGLAPYTVFDSRGAWWRQRKAIWNSFGIKSELGRDASLQRFSKFLEYQAGKGTSIFDPVLCEFAYRWFCPVGGIIFDPFAGGSVRGIAAALLRREYIGIDLREEQIIENRKQASAIIGEINKNASHKYPMPVWHVGDASDALKIVGKHHADFVWSCPGYVDRERYSNHPRDTSNQKSWAEFQALYREIIKVAVEILKPDSFCGFMVGEARRSTDMGEYYGFVPETVAAFEAAGARFYNDAVYLTGSGALGLTITKMFNGSRKFGKVHQNLLFFCKGDAKRAAARIGKVEFGDIGAPLSPYRSIMVHFRDEAGVAAFAAALEPALVGQAITAETVAIWYPEKDTEYTGDETNNGQQDGKAKAKTGTGRSAKPRTTGAEVEAQ